MLDTVKFQIPLDRQTCRRVFKKETKHGYRYLPRWVHGSIPTLKVNVNPTFDRQGFWIEASLPKFLQGHNICGINQLTLLCASVTKVICRRLGISLPDDVLKRIERGDILIGRVDITASFNLDDQRTVKCVLNEIREQLNANGRHVAVEESSGQVQSIYVRKHSRRITDKFYNKFAELGSHAKLPKGLAHKKQLLEYAKGLLRLETTIRAGELKRLGLNRARNWSRDEVRRIMGVRIARFQFVGNLKVRLDCAEAKGLTPRMRFVYHAWLEGIDLRKSMPTHTFRRARQSFLDRGIDIARTSLPRVRRVRLSEDLSAGSMLIGYPAHLAEFGLIFGARSR